MDKELLKKKLILLKTSESLLQTRETLFLQKAKQELLELDHTLDILTDDDHIDKTQILKEMAQQVIQIEPQSKISYQFLQQEEKNQKLADQELTSLSFYVEKYYHYFKKGSLLLIEGKKRSLFALIFGRHPKVLLSYEIATIAKEAEKDQKAIQPLAFTQIIEGKKIQQELLVLLEEIVNEAKKKWNQALYEQAFHLFFARVEKLYHHITTLLHDNANLAIQIDTKTILWLEKNLITTL